MIDLAVARLLHVVAVVLWIGGVAMVTMVVLPAARAARDPDGALQSMYRHHWLVLALSLRTVAGAAAGSHALL